MFKVYVTDYVFENFDPEREVLKDIDAELIPLQCKSSSELIDSAKDADALLNTYLPSIDGAVMDAMKNLKVIVRYGIGYNTIDTEAAAQRGIQVANVPDYCLEEVSDHAIALTLDLVRKVTFSCNRIKQKGEYSLNYLKPILPLQNAEVAIMGFGRIGRLIAKKLSVFGCRLNFYDPYIENDYSHEGIHVRKIVLDEVFRISDVIILQAPVAKENYHMLNEKAFSMMEKKPYIINTARGELIDNKALIQALSEDKISGAALDVVEGMPPLNTEEELLKFENVILTPHSAWVSENSSKQLQRLAAIEVVRVLKGEWAKSLVNPEVKNVLKSNSLKV